jgi:hypothetical protein
MNHNKTTRHLRPYALGLIYRRLPTACINHSVSVKQREGRGTIWGKVQELVLVHVGEPVLQRVAHVVVLSAYALAQSVVQFAQSIAGERAVVAQQVVDRAITRGLQNSAGIFER